MNQISKHNSPGIHYNSVAGIITCPVCYLVWTEEYVPLHCPKCGRKISDKAGHLCKYDSPGIYYSSLFGTITCLECNLFWLEEYIPLNCPKCGIKLTDKAGTGMEDAVRLIEKAGLPTAILECPQCRFQHPGFSDIKPQLCLRCHVPLVNVSPIKNIQRKIAWHSMRLKRSIAERF